MKKLVLTSLALLLGVAVVPAMAEEKSNNSSELAAFHALSKLSDPGQRAFNKMTDKQLAAVKGRLSMKLKKGLNARQRDNNATVNITINQNSGDDGSAG